MRNTLTRVLGWRATILQGDPSVVDRWRWLKRHLRGGPLRTLDAGCGSGAYTMYAARIGNHAVGVSFDPAQITRAQSRAALLGLTNIEFRTGDLRRLDEHAADLGTFDQVILFETIEHIKNDQKVVDDVARLMNPGGTLLLTAPYKNHHPLWGETVTDVEDGGHVRFGYTHEELRAILGRSGLEVVAEEFVSGLVTQKLAALQFGLTRLNTYAAWAATFPLRVLHPLDGPLTRLTSYPHLSVAVVGRKPA
jgi:SAM-dependent methyltransferase